MAERRWGIEEEMVVAEEEAEAESEPGRKPKADASPDEAED